MLETKREAQQAADDLNLVVGQRKTIVDNFADVISAAHAQHKKLTTQRTLAVAELQAREEDLRAELKSYGETHPGDDLDGVVFRRSEHVIASSVKVLAQAVLDGELPADVLLPNDKYINEKRAQLGALFEPPGVVFGEKTVVALAASSKE